MRTIINYLRECFCKHEFEYEEIVIKLFEDFWGRKKENCTKVSATCKKCGFHKKPYWKF